MTFYGNPAFKVLSDSSVYVPLIHNWLFVDNSGDHYEIIAEGSSKQTVIHDDIAWKSIQKKYNAE
jgi:hypothetical protein